MQLSGEVSLLISCLCYAFNNTFVKVVYTENITVLQVMFWSTVIQVVCLLLMNMNDLKQMVVVGDTKKIIIMIGLVVGSATTMLFFKNGISYSNVGNCMAITALLPFFVAPMSFLVLGDELSVLFFLCAVAATGGVMLILQPAFLFEESTLTPTETFGYVLMILGVLTLSAMYVAQRFAKIPSVPLTFWSRFLAAAGAGIYCIVQNENIKIHSNEAWAYLFILSMGQMAGKLVKSGGIAKIQPHRAALMNLFTTPFTYLLQFVVLGKEVNLTAIVGVFVTLAAVGYYQIQKTGQKAQKKE